MHPRFMISVAIAAVLAATALAARADDRTIVYRYHPAWIVSQPIVVEPAPAPVVFSYDPDERYARAYDMQGVITWSAPYHMTMRIEGDLYNVNLHDGTIIKPTGATLVRNMLVHVNGYWSNGTFIANRIVILRY